MSGLLHIHDSHSTPTPEYIEFDVDVRIRVSSRSRNLAGKAGAVIARQAARKIVAELNRDEGGCVNGAALLRISDVREIKHDWDCEQCGYSNDIGRSQCAYCGGVRHCP